jgi:hypothetical protein
MSIAPSPPALLRRLRAAAAAVVTATTLVATSIAAMGLLAAPGPAAAAQPAAERVEAWRGACKHYVNRARFKSREEHVEFVTVVADGCAAALKAAESPAEALSPDERAAAVWFLDRLTAARRAIAAINTRRLAAATERRRADRSFSRVARDLAEELRLVGHSGEYLILRAEGVYDALGAWVEAGAEFALLAALPR